MKNLIIITAAMKGGVGKSTLASLLASFIAKNGIPITVLDADIQQSIMQHRQLDLKEHPDVQIPWEVKPLIAATENDMLVVMKRIKARLSQEDVKGCVIIDCPGNVSDQTLKYVYNAADVIIIPFSYDCDNVHATAKFLNMLRQVSRAKIFLQPNRVVPYNYETQYDQRWRLAARNLVDKDHGEETLARIKDGKAVPKYSTLGITDPQEKAVENSFKNILKLIDEDIYGRKYQESDNK